MPRDGASCAVGVDIGGTNTVVAIIDPDNAAVLVRESIPTAPRRGPEDGFRRMGDLIERLCQAVNVLPADLVGIGVGCTGPVDSEHGTVNNPFTLPTWENAPLIAALTDRFGRPSILLNDAHVAALGEYWVGAGRGTRNLIYVTVGTGIGGGLILNGRLHRGVGQQSGEIGHQVIDINGPACYCGARGCLEMLAAAPAIERAARARVSPESAMLTLAGGDQSRITARIVYQAAQAGDPIATDLLAETGFYLGVGISNLLNTLAPEFVILGGGVMQGWDMISPRLHETVSARGGMIPFDQVRIVRAALDLNAGVIGAVRGILDHLAGTL
jgi:glucokinase